MKGTARIRARATYHDLSSAIPRKKKEIQKQREGENEKNMMLDNPENEK